MNNRIVLPILVMATLMLGCDNKQQTTNVNQLPNISVAYPLEDSVTLYATYPGYLEASNTVDIVARVSGFQVGSYYKPGQKVNKGDTLFIIEPTQYKDAVMQAEAALATAKAELFYAENNYNRMKRVADSEAISEIDLIKSEANFYQSQAAVKNAEAALQTARTVLNYCYIRAPFSGRPAKGVFSNGDYIAAGSANALMTTIYQDDEMYAYFNIDDMQYLKLVQNRQNNPARISTEAVKLEFNEKLPHEYEGHINYIAPNIDLSTGTMRMRLLVKNPYGELKHGLYTTIKLPYTPGGKSILVKDASIGTDQVGKYLYVVNDSNCVELRHIQLGEVYNDTLRIVESGLAPNERYVTRALQKVRAGMYINPVVENQMSE